MIKKLLPILLLLLGTGAGVGAGVFLRPAPEAALHAEAAEGEEALAGETPTGRGDHHAMSDREYVRMNNQFVIPIVENGAVASLVLLALSIETDPGHRDAVFTREPKLRDSFLQVLFDHANVGGFRGAFTENNNLDVLRAALREVAIRDAGDRVTDVLIHEIARQDY